MNTAQANELGGLLRHWRKLRGKSQLDLSLDSGVSQRHISFIESARSIPGRGTLAGLAEALEVPLRERNALWLAAGYAPAYSEAAWDAPEMARVNAVLARILRRHEPYPAVVMDRYWNVLLANQAVRKFFGGFIDMAARTGPRNLLLLMFDPAGLRPFIAEWEAVARSLLARVHREAVGRVLDEETRALLAALRDFAPVESGRVAGPRGVEMPFVPIGFVKDGVVLNYFSMVTTVGTPTTVAAQELRIECMYPADEATERAHGAMMGV